MMRLFTPLTSLLALSFALILAGTGCGGEETGVELEAVSTGADSEAETPAETDLSARLEGAFVYVRGPQLTFYDPGSTQGPVFLTEQFDPLTLAVAPGGDRLIYETDDYGDGHAHLIDLVTLEARELPTAINSRAASAWFVHEWSPDGSWVINRVFPRGFEAIPLAGGPGYELTRSDDAFVGWLADSTILVVDRNVQGGFGPNPDDAEIVVNYRSITRLDPATGESDEWVYDEAALQADFATTIQAMIAEHNLALAHDLFGDGVNVNPPENYVSFQSATEVCGTWTITRPAAEPGADPDVLYEAPNVHRITDWRALDDGSVLFLEWHLPDCRIGALPEITLRHLVPGSETGPAILGEHVFSEIALSLRNRFTLNNTGRLALSPDHSLVAWVEWDVEGGQTALNITDLATGQTSALLSEEQGEINPDSFAANQVFRMVLWATP